MATLPKKFKVKCNNPLEKRIVHRVCLGLGNTEHDSLDTNDPTRLYCFVNGRIGWTKHKGNIGSPTYSFRGFLEKL